jgi:hypothetical protein
MIPDIKCYIFDQVPSKPTLLELVVTSVAIDHQMAIIHVQVGENFVEDVLLNGGSGINIITKKTKGIIRSIKTKTCTLQSMYGLSNHYQT